ncbi:MAG: hypothetical protein P8J13_03395 [Gammaproteobacteria bacterium]|jgi:hypothetical protein|nr:hypothetical protein [Gammaproteobacteria bacterium]
MANYQHILLAIDTAEQSTQVSNKAAALVKQNQASLSICHLIENYLAPDFAHEGINHVTIEI